MLEDSFIGEGKQQQQNHLQFHLIQLRVAMGKSGKTTLETSIRKFLITFCCKFIIGCYFCTATTSMETAASERVKGKKRLSTMQFSSEVSNYYLLAST